MWNLVSRLELEAAVIKGAPLFFVVAVVLATAICAIVIWKAMQWGFGRELSFVKSQNTSLIRELQELREQRIPIRIPATETGSLETNIRLFHRYAWVFDGYRGTTREPGHQAAEIDPAIPLEKKYGTNEEVVFTLAVGNGNEKVTLHNVMLQATFVGRGLEIRAMPPWQTEEMNHRYTVQLGSIPSGVAFNPPDNLYVKFPEPGRYKILCRITSNDISPVEIPFEMILYK